MTPSFARWARLLLASAPLLGAVAATAQTPPPPTFDGWLCCNMRADGRWISDINYESATRVIPAAVAGAHHRLRHAGACTR